MFIKNLILLVKIPKYLFMISILILTLPSRLNINFVHTHHPKALVLHRALTLRTRSLTHFLDYLIYLVAEKRYAKRVLTVLLKTNFKASTNNKHFVFYILFINIAK